MAAVLRSPALADFGLTCPDCLAAANFAGPLRRRIQQRDTASNHFGDLANVLMSSLLLGLYICRQRGSHFVHESALLVSVRPQMRMYVKC